MKKILYVFSILFSIFISISCISCRKLFIGYNFWRVAKWKCSEFKITIYKEGQYVYDEYLSKEIEVDGEIKLTILKEDF